MNATEWIKSGRDYKEGIKILKESPFANKRLARILSIQKNEGTLLYEMQKLAKKEAFLQKKLRVKTAIALEKSKVEEKKAVEPKTERYFPPVKLADLPRALHPVFIEQKQNFYKVASMKILLNDLPADDTDNARKIIEQLFFLWQQIDIAWMKIDYWLEHKKILTESVNDFSGYSPMELLMHRQKLYQKISKRKKTIEKWQKKYEQLEGIKQEKYAVKLEKKIEDLKKLELELNRVNREIKK